MVELTKGSFIISGAGAEAAFVGVGTFLSAGVLGVGANIFELSF